MLMLVLKCVPAPAPAIDTRPVVGAAAAEEEVVVKQEVGMLRRKA